MKIFTNRIMIFLFVIMATTIFGCEAGMDSGKNSNESTTGKFSFSDMYEKISALDTKFTTMENTISEQLNTIDEQAKTIAQLQDALSGQSESLTSLEGTVLSHTVALNSQGDSVSGLQDDIDTISATFQGVTRNGNNLVFSGMNVNIVNGTNSTLSVNGLGNLVIGYNEVRPGGHDVCEWMTYNGEKKYVCTFRDNTRTGSHNIVLGTENNYSGSSGIVTGMLNSISGNYGYIIGGCSNEVLNGYFGFFIEKQYQ
ncbi:MAG: hypothetical protein GY754_01880 [bacterium]|nr:hypothetical protein [bacterium]